MTLLNCTWAINWSGKNAVSNLEYGPSTQLGRGTCFELHVVGSLYYFYHYHYTGWPWQTIGGARTIWPDNSETDRVHGSSHKGKQGSDENIKRSRGCYFTNRVCLLMWPEAIFAKNVWFQKISIPPPRMVLPIIPPHPLRISVPEGSCITPPPPRNFLFSFSWPYIAAFRDFRPLTA